MKSKRLHRIKWQKSTMLSLLFLSLWGMTACHEQTHHYSYQPVNKTGWNKSDTLFYTLNTPLPPNQAYECEVGIRHKDSYKYRDIWLTAECDTLHIYLADSIGNWLGNGIGELRHLTSCFTFHVTDDTLKNIRITHIMQDNPLSAIEHIGIRVRAKH